MSEFKKKPVIIEAFLWTKRPDQTEDPEWIVEAIKKDEVRIEESLTAAGGIQMHIKTLEGTMTASVGDYIIKGVKGELYPCKPDIFELTYDRAPQTFKDRLVIEGDELTEKILKHTKALDSKKVPESEVSILQIQLSIMTSYLTVLTERLVKLG